MPAEFEIFFVARREILSAAFYAAAAGTDMRA
jgi:hypothetical protein